MQLSYRDILRAFHVSENTVREWMEKRGLPFVRVNEQYRFNYTSLLEWALEHNIPLTPDLLNFREAELEGQMLNNALKRGDIHYNVPGTNVEEVLKEVVNVLPVPEEVDRGNLFEMLWTRELMGSTGIGNGIAIPHVRNPIIMHVDEPIITVCFLQKPIDFKAIDHKPVSTLFIVLSPSIKMHLALLARLAYCLQNPKLQDYLDQKRNREEILAAFFVLESKLSSDKTSGS